MKRVIAPLAIAACMLLALVGAALAGQPGTNAGVNCGTAGATMTPGIQGRRRKGISIRGWKVRQCLRQRV